MRLHDWTAFVIVWGIFMIKNELWKDIIGYQGLYQISNFGNVKSLKYNHTKTEKLLKPELSRGYLQVTLCKNKDVKRYKISRLVATFFIPNFEKKPFVNHINGIKTDNTVENLEWCTASENMIHAYKKGLQFSKKGIDNVLSISIANIDKDGNIIKKYGSMREASKHTNCNLKSIRMCCSGKIKSVKGLIFKTL